MKGQDLKGHLDLLLLAVLATGPAHGYAVIERLRQNSDERFDLPEGTVYPALHRLERSGHLSSEWSVVDGRRRRTYRLTSRGVDSLAEKRRGWQEFSGAVSSVLGGAPWPVAT
jgi:PadR family transcriptional regulator PadR